MDGAATSAASERARVRSRGSPRSAHRRTRIAFRLNHAAADRGGEPHGGAPPGGRRLAGPRRATRRRRGRPLGGRGRSSRRLLRALRARALPEAGRAALRALALPAAVLQLCGRGHSLRRLGQLCGCGRSLRRLEQLSGRGRSLRRLLVPGAPPEGQHSRRPIQQHTRIPICSADQSWSRASRMRLLRKAASQRGSNEHAKGDARDYRLRI